MYWLSGRLLYESTQKNGRLRQPLQKFSSLCKAETVDECKLKVLLLLQVSSHDFEPTFIIFCLKMFFSVNQIDDIQSSNKKQSWTFSLLCL